MIADAAGHGLVVTAEDGIIAGGIGSQIVEALAAAVPGRAAPTSIVLATPVDYIPHGNPDKILAELGLDAAGITAVVRVALSTRART